MTHHDAKKPVEGTGVDGQDLSSDLSVESGDAGTGTDFACMTPWALVVSGFILWLMKNPLWHHYGDDPQGCQA